MLYIFSVVNTLKTCLKPFLIRSSRSDAIELDELIDVMAQGRTTLSKPDITGCLQLLVEEVTKLVSDGKFVKTPLGAFYLSAGGKLETKNQAFTPGVGTLDHELTLHFRTNKTVEDRIKSNARWERIENFDTSAASIDSVTVAGRASGEAAGAGDTLVLSGRRLKFDSADETCGVFFESAAESIRAVVYADITPSKVIAVIPAGLTAGTWDIVVSTKPNGKDIKEGYYGDFVIA